jgi:amino acid adenylation domain-containing protein
LPIQYADYAAWQRAWLQGARLQGHLDFWTEHLQGAPALLELPLDRPRPPVQSHAGATLHAVIPAELAQGLRRLGQRHGTTLFMTLLAGWAVLLARLSGQDDLVVGTPTANRQRAELESLIGLFVNTLALRVRLHDDPTVGALLEQVKATTLAAYEHQDLPFEQVVEALRPPRSLAHGPVFQVMLTLDNTPDPQELDLHGLTVRTSATGQATTQFDLSLSLTEAGDLIEAEFEYASDLFERDTIVRLAECFQVLLGAMAENPGLPVSRLALLTPGQRQQLLAQFNPAPADWPPATLHQLVEAQAARTPHAPALLCGEATLGYDEMNRRANRLAHYLIGLGVARDDRVAICIERGIDMVVGLLGILKAGAAYVPLDPAYPSQRLHYMIGDSAPRALLAGTATRALLPDAGVPVLCLDAAGTAAALAGQPDHDPRRAAPGDLAYVLYTSGSTGQPKGVMVEHRNVVNLVRHHVGACAIDGRDTVLQFASIGFDTSVTEIFPALAAGARVVLRPPHLVTPDDGFAAFLAAHGVTIADLPTAFWHGWADEVARGRSLPGGALRLVIVGGEKAEQRALRAWLGAPLAAAPRWLNTYGPTEATIYATAEAYRHGDSAPAHEIPIGRPVANTRIYVLDRHLEPVPPGVAGEIHIAGAGVARGYLNRPELSAERFLADPFQPCARMYKTGDLGSWQADGTLRYLARNDFQVKLRGFRIELGEIEAALADFPGVDRALVLPRQDQPGEPRLVAYLLGSGEVDAAALRRHLGARLPEHMLPSAFVHIDALPLTPNGKLDRNLLPAPGIGDVLTRAYEAPQGAVEQALASLWQELLGLERIGRHDHFFELGGHSLMALQLTARIEAQLALAVPVRTLFEYPVLSQFTEQVLLEPMDRFEQDDIQALERQLASLNEEELLAMLNGENKNG